MKKKKKLTRRNRPINSNFQEPTKKERYLENLPVIIDDELTPKKKSPLKLARHKKKRRKLKKWVYFLFFLIIILIIYAVINLHNL